MYLPTWERTGMAGATGLGAWLEAGLYDGPLYPRVTDNGDGTRDVAWNPEQTSPACPVAEYWGEPYPRMNPHPTGGPGQYELWIHPGRVYQGTLDDRGIIMGPNKIVMLPADCRPNEHPSIEFGGPGPEFDPLDPCSMNYPTFTGQTLETVDPLTGQVYTDIYHAPDGCSSLYLWEDGTPLRRDEYPFEQPFAYDPLFGVYTRGVCIYGGLQGPCPSDPNYQTTAPGSGGYATGTKGAPYRPWSEPGSSWYGHRVISLREYGVADPLAPEPEDEPEYPGPAGPPLGPTGEPGPYAPPCRSCDTVQLVNGEPMCIPEPGCEGPQPAPPEPAECWLGLDPEPPHGDLWDYECLFPPPPPPPEGPTGNGGGGQPPPPPPTGGNGGTTPPPTGTTPAPTFDTARVAGLAAAGLAFFMLANRRKRDR